MNKNKNTAENNYFADRFRIIAAHRGGMAEVLICQDIFNSRIVAAKTPYHLPELFSREARLWLGLGKHPNIVRAHLVHNIDDYPYLFMDFIGDSSGKSLNLRHSLNSGQKKINFVIDLGLAVIRALQHAETVFPGFVHRDIKPENIFVAKDANFYLSDFGIGHISRGEVLEANKKNSKQIVTGSTYHTKAGSFVGTAGYASPEQYFDSSSVTYKSDIYSLGVSLYEVMTGEIPYSLQMIEKEGFQILKLPVRIPDTFHDETEVSLWEIIIKMLSFDPDDRQGSLGDLKYQLSELKKGYSTSDNDGINYKNDKLSKTTVLNRLYSLIELDEYRLATSQIISFQKRYPLSIDFTALSRNLFSRMSSKTRWGLLRKMVIADLSNPLRLFLFAIFSIFLISPMCIAITKFDLSLIKFGMGLGLLLILFIDKYINSRTAISLNIITLPGIIAGITFSLFTNFTHYHSFTGNIWESIAGIGVGFMIPAFLGRAYYAFTKREWIGGGTMKLLAMIGSWVGLLVSQIILLAILIILFQSIVFLLLQKLSGELKWSKGTLIPRLHRRMEIVIPTSTSVFWATWLVISFPEINSIIWPF